MAFIEVIDHENAEGRLKEIYDDLVKSRGKLANVHMMQSLHPESIVGHMELYMQVMFAKSPLRRYQREMIATVVSAANKCPYCMTHHGDALMHFWKDEEKVSLLKQDYTQVALAEPDAALCSYAAKLTQTPDAMAETDVAVLQEHGFDDRAVLDATLVTSYFNFVNRMVLGLGVHLEKEGGEGYKYD